MPEFTSIFNEKEITFTETGIRYNNEIFINYRDMRDISHRTDGKNALIFRYKDRLVRLPYNPEDKPEIMPYIGIAMRESREAEKEAKEKPKEAEQQSITLPTSVNELDQFDYLDQGEEPEPDYNKPKKKGGKGALIALGVIGVIAIAAIVLIIIL